jgi:hypothetical protein
MAESNVADFRNETAVEIFEACWGIGITASRDILVGDGFVPRGAVFPGDGPGVPKTALSMRDADGRVIRIERKRANRFFVHREWTDQERNEYEQRQRLQKAREAAAKQVEDWPKSEGEFRQRVSDLGNIALQMLQNTVASGRDGGYTYDPETVRRIEQLAGEVRATLQVGRVVFDPEIRERNMPEVLRG